MDPNFIHLDWERTFEALMLVAVVSIISAARFLDRWGHVFLGPHPGLHEQQFRSRAHGAELAWS